MLFHHVPPMKHFGDFRLEGQENAEDQPLNAKRILRLPKQEFNASYRRVYKIRGAARLAYQDAVIYPIRPFYPVRLPLRSLIDELMYPEHGDESTLED